jgi:hypothetical protein
MQEFLKGKFLKELIKGVQGMRAFVYPSVLQSAALPVLKKSEQKNVIVRYSEMSGIKLTLLLPIINQQIKHVVQTEKLTYSIVICHSNARCQQLAEFAEELTAFSKTIIDIIVFDSSDLADIKIQWKNSCEEKKIQSDEAQHEQIRLRNKVLFVTPAIALAIFGKNGFLGDCECFSMVIDKVNLLQAYDLDQDLIELVK